LKNYLLKTSNIHLIIKLEINTLLSSLVLFSLSIIIYSYLNINNNIKGGEKMGKVELNRKNISRCLCKTCPVQTESNCSKDKIALIDKKLDQEGSLKEIFETDELALLYCSFGKAACDDLSSNELCKCTQCTVWLENNLANNDPIEYFCVEGVPK